MSPAATMSPLPTGSPFADVQLKMRQLQSQLDDLFAQSFRDFGNDFSQTGFASSVDLREQKDRYVARIYLPNGDTSKVNAKINGNNLEITMSGAEKNNGTTASENYQQVITLPQPVRADQMEVQRKADMVVITIPKSNPTAVAAASPINPAPVVSPTAGNLADWDQRMIDEMRRTEQQMTKMFRDAFPHDVTNGNNALQLGSSVKVDDQKDKYVVHFALPNRDVSNVKVDFENGELRLTAQEQKNNSSSSGQSSMSSRYEEMISLPGAVKQNEMQVNRQANAVVVTLPKA
jgi:HSP20 family molecular chaperone IbpA